MRTGPGPRRETESQRQNEKGGNEKDGDGSKNERNEPKGRTQSDKRPNRERGVRVRRGWGGSGLAWRVSGVKELWFIAMSQLPSIPGDTAHPASHPHPPAAI